MNFLKLIHGFLQHIYDICQVDKRIKENALDESSLRQAKQFGLSDSYLAKLSKTDEATIRHQRETWCIKPVVKQIDTLAGEFEAQTNYLYLTYHGEFDDIEPSNKSPVII